MGTADSSVIIRLAESSDFVEVDGWRRALEGAGIRARLARQSGPYSSARYILYIFQEDADRAVRALGWAPDASAVDPAYTEDALRDRPGSVSGAGHPFSSPMRVILPVTGLAALAFLVISLLVRFLP